jgi:hypothetical protein
VGERKALFGGKFVLHLLHRVLTQGWSLRREGNN